MFDDVFCKTVVVCICVLRKENTLPNIVSVLPEILLSCVGILFFLINKYRTANTPKTFYSLSKYSLYLFVLGEITLRYFDVKSDFFHNDAMTVFYKIILSVSALIIFSMSCKWFLSKNLNSAMFYALSLWLFCGLMLVISTNHLMILCGGMILIMLMQYALSLLYKEDEERQTGHQFGIFSAIMMLILISSLAYVYHQTLSWDIKSIAMHYKNKSLNIWDNMAYLGFMLNIIYMLGMFPTHISKIQAHKAAILPSSTVIQVLPLLGGYGCFVFFSGQTVVSDFKLIFQLIHLFAFISIFWGAFSLIKENNLKAMISYSCLYAIGVAILSLKNFDKDNLLSSLLYLIIFTVSVLGIYGILFSLKYKGEYLSELSSVQGLYSQKPMLAVLLCVFLMSIAGMPLSLGFIGKLQIVDSFVLLEEYWVMFFFFMAFFLILIAYLNIINQVFFSEKCQNLDRINNGSIFWISVFIIVFLIGILNPAFYIENLEKLIR